MRTFFDAIRKSIRGGLFLGALAVASTGMAQQLDGKNQSTLTQQMGITQSLGTVVPKEIPFKDETGKDVKFGEFLRGKPVFLVPIFYRCQTGCVLVIDGMVKTITKANKDGKLFVGRDYDVVMVSIHPKETPSLALAKKNLIIKDLAPKDPPAGWDKMVAGGLHLLTGNRDSINRLTQAVGFKYSYNEKKDLINHPTCTVLLSPEGKVSSYTIGNEFPTRVVETNLALASKNQIGEKADQSMMFGCIMLDPATGKYRVVIENVLRLSGLITVIILAFSIYSMNLKSKREELLRRDKSSLGASS